MESEPLFILNPKIVESIISSFELCRMNFKFFVESIVDRHIQIQILNKEIYFDNMAESREAPGL